VEPPPAEAGGFL